MTMIKDGPILRHAYEKLKIIPNNLETIYLSKLFIYFNIIYLRVFHIFGH